MRKFCFLLLITFLLSMSAQLNVRILIVAAAPPIHQGDLIIGGNDVFTIKNEVFTINGSIEVIENATLELKDAVVNFTQVYNYQHNILFRHGNPKLKADNATIVSAYNMSIAFEENSSAVIDDFHSSNSIGIGAYRATLSMSYSEAYRYFGTASNVAISNCEFEDFESYGDTMAISDSTLGTCYIVGSTIVMSNSSTKDLHALGSKTSISVSDNFRVNGSILLEHNATLILRNAILEFLQEEAYQFNMTFMNPAYGGNPRLIVENATITTSYGSIHLNLFYNSSASIDKLVAPRVHLYIQPAVVSVSNSTLSVVYVTWDSILDIVDSSLSILSAGDDSSVNIRNCSLAALWNSGASTSNASDCIIEEIETHLQSTVWLLNSTYARADVYNQSNVYVSWYLDVHVVDSIDQDIPYANVTAFYQNATVAESQLTEANGWTRLTLIGNMMNSTADYPVGNYTIEATYEIHSDNATLNMTDNKQITLTLEDFVIPEFPPILILPLFMMATLLTVLVYRRKDHTLSQT